MDEKRAAKRTTTKKATKRHSRPSQDELSTEQRDLLKKAAARSNELTIDALAREQASKNITKIRAARDGYSTAQLKLLSPEDLAEPVGPLRFLITGVWDEGGFGPFGGAKKSLKSWCAMIHSFAIASGVPSFGHEPWEVPNPRPVLYICGEGGENLVRRRFQRIADMYEVQLSSIPLYVVVGVAPFNSDEFRRQIHRHVETISGEHAEPPGLVVLDSLYNFHPPDVDVANLYGRGGLLSDLGHWVRAITSYDFQPDGAALWIIDHFNKTGKGLDLDRYGQAGMNAWASTWWNAEVIEEDPESGDFALRVIVGSREGFSHGYALSVSLGRFNYDTGAYDGELKVVVTSGDPGPSPKQSTDRVSNAAISDGIVEQLTADPYTLTKNKAVEQVRERLGAGRDRVKHMWESLAERDLIHARPGEVIEGHRVRTRSVWAAGSAPTQPGNSTGRKKRK